MLRFIGIKIKNNFSSICRPRNCRPEREWSKLALSRVLDRNEHCTGYYRLLQWEHYFGIKILVCSLDFRGPKV